MSRKKVWNSIVRRKKKNHMDLKSKDENSSTSVSPLLRRVSTLPRRGSQQRHTLDPEMSSLREHDPNLLFPESLVPCIARHPPASRCESQMGRARGGRLHAPPILRGPPDDAPKRMTHNRHGWERTRGAANGFERGQELIYRVMDGRIKLWLL
ncbi:hypothetical protein KM043_015344 [Ampulex compressa]|nr:hypothetical protein KM043_015344 [Ampulex compressa]